MLPYLSLFGRLMPTYGVLGMAGLGFGLLAALLRCKRFGLSRDDCAYLYILGAVGALVGAKLLYLLPLLPRLAVELPLLWEEPGEFYARYLSGGMVFYGGFFGGVAAAWGAAKYLRLRLSDFFPVLVPALPLVHAVGRVGCFCAGCCYGRAAPPPWGAGPGGACWTIRKLSIPPRPPLCLGPVWAGRAVDAAQLDAIHPAGAPGHSGQPLGQDQQVIGLHRFRLLPTGFLPGRSPDGPP